MAATAYQSTATTVKRNDESLSQTGMVRVISTNSFATGDSIRVKKYKGLSVVLVGITSDRGNANTTATVADNIITITDASLVAPAAANSIKVNVLYTYLKVR